MSHNHCAIDALESRRHLSAVLRGTTLFVNGNETGNNTISVTSASAGTRVQVKVNNDAAQTFDKTKVVILNIHTRAGNDTITIGSGTCREARIYAGNGNNTITTGSERDFIYTGDGKDVINAGARNNYIVSGAGDDNITTGSGNDQIWSGAGNDIVTAGSGNDLVFAAAGNDNVNGGSGNDTLHGGDGDDIIIGSAGNDRLWGQRGNDNINGGSGNDFLGGIVGTSNTLIGSDGVDTFYVKKDLTGQTNDFVTGTDILHPVPGGDGSVES